MVKVTIEKELCLVYIGDEKYSLSKNEILIIELLYSNPERVLSVAEISKQCWPGRIVSNASVPVSIKHIRDVFKEHFACNIILTVKGVGYRFSQGSVDINIVDKLDESNKETETETETETPIFFFDKKISYSPLNHNMLLCACYCIVMLIMLLLYFQSYEYVREYYDGTKNIRQLSNSSKSATSDILNLNATNETIFVEGGFVVDCLNDQVCKESERQ